MNSNLPVKLSFCCVVKDSLSNIKNLIENVKDIVDEIVIVDTGSSDEVKRYEKQCTKKSFFLPWNEDFSYMHNYAIEKSSGEWILSLDSDETINSTLKNKIRDLINSDNNEIIEGYKFNRIHYFDEEPMRDHWRHLRLYRRKAVYFGAVHESIKNLEKVKEITSPDCFIEHHNTRSEEKEKSKRYSLWLKNKIEQAKKVGNKNLATFYEYKKWVQDKVYFVETDSNASAGQLEELYKEYETKKKDIDKLELNF